MLTRWLAGPANTSDPILRTDTGIPSVPRAEVVFSPAKTFEIWPTLAKLKEKEWTWTLDPQPQAYYKDRRIYCPTQPVWLWTPRLRPGQSRKFALYWTGTW
jgi:hypothetical protein